MSDPAEDEDLSQLKFDAPFASSAEDESDWMQQSVETYTSPFAGLSLYAEEGEDNPPPEPETAALAESVAAPVAPAAPATPAEAAPAEPPAAPKTPVAPQRTVTELAPEELQENLIVGDFSLNSGDSQYKQEESMLNYLIKNALLDQASAIHIEPQDRYLRLRYRIGGVLQQKTALPQNLGMPMLARLKQLCALHTETTQSPQRNRVQARFNDKEFELGIATYPSIWGENMVLNIRPKRGANPTELLRLENTGLSPLYLRRFQKLLSQPGGLVIVTGPAREGKTTTLYAALNHLNLLTRSIVTAESPVEHVLTGIIQGNWTPENETSYAEMIKSMSFLDPDVLMVSELDSPETLEATIELALSGAKVITTYPSFDTMGALSRLVSQGLRNYLIASNNLTVVSQRLVRKLCQECKQQETPKREILDMLGLTAVDPEAFPVYRARGCATCNQVGYSGQTALHEILVINESIRTGLLDRHFSATTLRELAHSEAKLVSMAEDGYYKAVEGITSLAEVQRVAFINEADAHEPREAEKIHKVCRGEDKRFL